MSETSNVTEQTAASDAESGNIMQGIQDMIGDLLKNAVDKMQKTEIKKQLGDTSVDVHEDVGLPAQMGIAEVKGFVTVMQKFIDNVNVVINQLETGSDQGDTDDQFLDGYMATADNVLEIAAFSMKDSLTGLSNRYGFDNRLILEWNRATRDKSALSLVIFGVDGFEECEDLEARDNLLKIVSETLDKSIKRTTDFMARWSDNEFAALLPITGAEGVAIVAKRISDEIGEKEIPCITKPGGKTSVSIGAYVHTPEPGEKPVDFVNKAYDSYKKAKDSGGGSTVFA